jgi:hypothetical protein
MEDYMHTIYLKSSEILNDDEIESLSALLKYNKGIENFRISSDGIYLEYNTYLYSQIQIEEILLKTGFRKKKDRRLGFFRRQITNLAKSNKKTYGNQKLDCCQLNE